LLLFFKKEALSFLALFFCCAANVDVLVTGVRNDRGHVRVAVCGPADFLHPKCPYFTRVPARAGQVRARVSGVPAGRYAAEAFHDENDNDVLDLSFQMMRGCGSGRQGSMRLRLRCRRGECKSPSTSNTIE
jgi:uncharacterized protein (DUF2141 family)